MAFLPVPSGEMLTLVPVRPPNISIYWDNDTTLRHKTQSPFFSVDFSSMAVWVLGNVLLVQKLWMDADY